MSWSLSSEGTIAGIKRHLAEQKIYGTPMPEEQAVFDYARDTILKIVGTNPESSDPKQKLLFMVSAAGHGVQVSSISVTYKYVNVE